MSVELSANLRTKTYFRCQIDVKVNVMALGILLSRIMNRSRILALLYPALLAGCLMSSVSSTRAESLPSLGDASSAIVSPEQEYRLGRAWLRQLRSQAPLIQDPIIYDYLYSLVYRLAAASDISEPNIEMVVINSPEINAFAVPGGVVGFNGGLLISARSEDELSSVIAHELAHLSQRHFARGVEKSQQNSLVNLAAVLASIALIAAGGGDAGMAALATTQAVAIDSQLRFSRANEQEADRVGMQTLVRAGMNPEAMADFFEALQRSQRYSGFQAPEFLLTHPVTESRISDARVRADQYPRISNADSLEFQLIKSRAEVEFSRDNVAKIQDLNAQRDANEATLEVIEYGLACAYNKTNQFKQALEHIDALLKKRPNRITYLATKADILTQSGKYSEAIKTLETGLQYNPKNYVLSVHYADALILEKQYEKAITILREQVTVHPNWPILWSLLAEAYAKNDQRLNGFQAKAEYYFLYGRSQKAIEQLNFALPLAKEDFNKTAAITTRIEEIQRSMKDLEF